MIKWAAALYLAVVSSCTMEPAFAADHQLVVRAPPRHRLVNPDPLRLKVQIFSAPLTEVRRLCRVVNRHSHGDFCTQFARPFREHATWNPCVIYLPAGYGGEAREIILRHARAECYGWRHL